METFLLFLILFVPLLLLLIPIAFLLGKAVDSFITFWTTGE